MIDVKKLRALLAAATPQPWEVDYNGHRAETPPFIRPEPATGYTIADEQACITPDDAELIAEAVNALPELLDAVEELVTVKGLLADAVEALEESAWLAGFGEDIERIPDRDEWRERCRAALAKPPEAE